MQVDYIIVGQGISGTMLSWFLHRENKSFLVFDDARDNAASQVAAGIINPVTGRRYAYTWMIDEIMPFAVSVYESMQVLFGSRVIAEKSIIDFFPSPQMRNAFVDRLTENDTYLHSYPDQNHFNPYFHYDFGCGEVKPCYMADVQKVIKTWRSILNELNALRQETLSVSDIDLHSHGVTCKGVNAGKIIFCDGGFGTGNPWFRLLPFAPNKGEVLIIKCPGLNQEHIFKKGLMLAPLPEPGLFWVGSNYQWEFDDELPSEKFFNHATSVLKGWLKQPFEVIQHKAAVRPATLERRPFVGFHPVHPQIGILNGMGTKGTSLAPFFAHQLVQHLVYNFPIAAEADVQRFSRILSR